MADNMCNYEALYGLARLDLRPKNVDDTLRGLVGLCKGVLTEVIPIRASPTRRNSPCSASRISELSSLYNSSTARG